MHTHAEHRVGDLLATAAAQLPQSASAKLDAEVLLANILKRPTAWLLAHADAVVAPPARAQFQQWIARRANGEPVARMTGEKEFFSLMFETPPGVFIPRADTETLVETALNFLQRAAQAKPKVCDLGAGVGAVGLSLAHNMPTMDLTLTDICETALNAAKRNANKHNIAARFANGDWFAAVGAQKFDALVANPPYIRTNDPALEEAVAQSEPGKALFAGDDGLRELQRIIRNAPAHLESRGMLAVEHGYAQGDAVKKMFAKDFCEIELVRDLAGRARVTCGVFAG